MRTPKLHKLTPQSDSVYQQILEKIKITKQDFLRVNKHTLKVGAKVETEHTDNPKLAQTIALQHIKEHPSINTPTKLDSDYYTMLKKMEKKL